MSENLVQAGVQGSALNTGFVGSLLGAKKQCIQILFITSVLWKKKKKVLQETWQKAGFGSNYL